MCFAHALLQRQGVAVAALPVARQGMIVGEYGSFKVAYSGVHEHPLDLSSGVW
jgi:hypothetical protein